MALSVHPALAEPYRPLPRYPPGKVKERVAGSRAAQRLHPDAPAAPIAVADEGPQADAEESVHVIAIPPLPGSPPPAAHARRTTPAPARRAPGAAAAVEAAARPAPAAPADAPADERGARVAAGEPPAAPVPETRTAELKVSVGQDGSGGGIVMLVEDPSGVRIELTLDAGGRLLAVRRAGAM